MLSLNRSGFAALIAVALLAHFAAGQTTTRVSISSAGLQANGASHTARLSDDGRYVAFRSTANNLVPGDTNGVLDVFLRDRVANTTVLVSVGMAGPANGPSDFPAISADGRWVAFASAAANIVPGDTDDSYDVFLRDVPGGVTYPISVGLSGLPVGGGLPAVSGDGRFVAFYSLSHDLVPDDTNSWTDIFVRDRIAGTTVRASVGAGGQSNGDSFHADISSDGRYVVFDSYAGNFVADDPNAGLDVFVRDLVLGTTVRASTAWDGSAANGADCNFPSISDDGRSVLFSSMASNLVPGDGNAKWDDFVRDLQAGTTTRVSVSSTGNEAVVGVDGAIAASAISPNGRWVTFASLSPNLVPGDTNGAEDVFVHDLLTLSTTRTSVSSTGAQSNGRSAGPCISADGRITVFDSLGNNLVAETDSNAAYDVFAHEVPAPWTDLGAGLAGTNGVPQLVGEGTLAGGSSGQLVLVDAKGSAAVLLLVSVSTTPVAFKGGTLLAFPPVLSVPLVTGASGKVFLPFTWPSGVPTGTSFWFQFAIADPVAVQGVALSNALVGLTP